MKKSRILPGIAIASALALTACSGGTGNGESQESMTLTYAAFVPEDHPYSVWFKDWAEQITEETDGRIQFTEYYAESLVPATELAPAAADGRADLVQTNTNYHPELFPLSEISAVPYENEEIAATVKAFTELYQTDDAYRDEFERNNLVALQFQPTGSSVVGATRSVSSGEEIGGGRFRANSFLADFTVANGGDPLSMPLGDVYQSMDTGLLDGFMTVLENFPQYSLTEVVDHVADPQVGPNGLSAILMNKDIYDGLSEEDREIFDRLSADFNQRWVSEMLNGMDAETCELMAEFPDIEMTVWSDDDVEAAQEAAGDVYTDKFIEQVNSNGGDGAAFLEQWRERQAEYDGSYGEYQGSVETCQN